VMPQFGESLMVINYAPVVFNYAPNIVTIEATGFRVMLARTFIKFVGRILPCSQMSNQWPVL
jgi:hypothetical protein